jgi:hypothetical protein
MRLRQYTSTVGWKPSSSRRSPQATFQAMSRRKRAAGLPVRQTLQGLQHHHRRDHLGRHRGVAATLASQVGQQPGWEQLVAMVGQEGVHRALRDQVAAPGRRVQLVIGGMALGAHARESAPPTPAARTTGSTQPTESAEPRPFSRLLGGQPGSPRTPGRARRGCSSRTGRNGDRLADGLATQASVQVNGTIDANVMTIRPRQQSSACRLRRGYRP